jgi:hypothetical protein
VTAAGPRLHRVRLSHVDLDPRWGVSREPLTPTEARGPGFAARFDATTLFYDLYRSVDGGKGIALGPPLRSIDASCLRFSLVEDGPPLAWRASPEITNPTPLTPSRLEIAALPGVDVLWVAIGSQRWRVPVQPNLSDAFAVRTALLTTSGDNPLLWIEDWARYHAAICGVDAIVLYGNASTLADAAEIAERLATIPGLRDIAVIDQPARFGVRKQDMRDPSAGQTDCLLQTAMLRHGLDRLLGRAAAALNLDIDEVLVLEDGVTIPWLLDRPEPMVNLSRANVNAPVDLPAPALPRHRHATHRFEPFPDTAIAKKWLLRPPTLPDEYVVGIHGSRLVPAWQLPPERGFVAHFWELTTSLGDPRRFAAPVDLAAPCALLTRRLAEAFPDAETN